MNSAGSSPVDAPPAYSFAQEFDQKLALAVDESLRTSSGKRREDEEAEERRDANEGSGPSERITPNGRVPVVKPLSFKKKHNRLHSDLPPPKERPSWLEDAQQAGSSTSTSNPRRRSLPQPHGQRVQDDSSRLLPNPYEDGGDRSLPPPPFIAVDNSLDGPAYERYPSDARRRRAAGHGQVGMHYSGDNTLASPPPSPLLQTRPQHMQQHGRLQVRAPANRSPSPAANKQHLFAQSAPRVNFDPSVAYDTSQSLYGDYSADPTPVAGGAAALYSSAVAPHLSGTKASSLSVPKTNRYTSSTNLPVYDHRSPSPYGVQDFATSSVSVYSTSTMSSNASPMMSQYPQTHYGSQPGHLRPGVAQGHQYLPR